jgi:cellulose synthase/poly-beta-1,6-N-acetylglucosamine synthase-like glycosyltransferase
MRHIEIPLNSEKTKRYRFFEILPGALSWTILVLPFVLSIFAPTVVAFIILLFFLFWFARAVGLNIRTIQGWRMLQRQQKLDWSKMLDELEHLDPKHHSKALPKWHYQTIERLKEQPTPVTPDEVIHAVFVTAYNESIDILEPTIQSVIDCDYDMKRVILVFAYEGRDGAQSEGPVLELQKKYGDKFMDCLAFKHPLTKGEVRGKGGNFNYAARGLQKYLEERKMDPSKVMVTMLDADNRPHKKYFSALSYVFSATPDPKHVSYQPIPMFTNNIWDVPAPMRVIATGNSFWNLVLSLRPHMLRNFSSHSQSMDALIETNFLSARTIVEDGHQFWRSYFKFEGNYEVYPIYLPIYQDAVLADTYRKTLRVQFNQIRRWAYGASDVAYVAEKAFFTPNNISKFDRLAKFLRLLEGHISWATAPLILAFAAFIPALLNADNIAANQLPIIASRIQTIALAGIFITLLLSMRLLPPKPERYKHHRTVFMVLQWVLLPLTTIMYNAIAALNSQTRLMFGWYLDKFEVTDKAVKK